MFEALTGGVGVAYLSGNQKDRMDMLKFIFAINVFWMVSVFCITSWLCL